MKDRIASVIMGAWQSLCGTGVSPVRALAVAAAVGFGSARADIPASAYVQDGLIVQFDGLENAGAGSHDGAATTWTDLSGNGRNGTISGSYSWLGNGLQINSVSGKGLVTFDAAHNEAFTFDICLKVDKAYGAYARITAEDETPAMCCYGKGSSLTAAHPYVYGGAKDDKDIGATEYDATVLHTSTLLQSGDAADGWLWYHDGALLAQSSCVQTSTGSATATLGNRSSDYARGLNGVYYSVRVYNRALTAEEIALNAAIDKARFADGEGFRWNAELGRVETRLNVAVDPTKGSVTVNGEQVPSDGVLWLPLCATVTLAATPADGLYFNRWTGSAVKSAERLSSTFEFRADAPATLGASFVDEQYALTSASYVQDGLVAQFDGIENAVAGTHDAAATEWVNLAGGSGDAVLPVGKYTVTGNSVLFASDRAVAESVSCATSRSSITLEGCVRATAAPTGANDLLFVNVASRGGVGYDARNGNGYSYYQPNGSTWGSQKSIYKWWGNFNFADRAYDRHTVSAIIPVNGTTGGTAGKVLQDGVAQAYKSNWTSAAQAAPSGQVYIGSTGVDCEMYAVRVYDRELTAEEVEWNAKIDSYRFSGRPEAYRYRPDGKVFEQRVLATCADGHGEIAVGETTAATVTGWGRSTESLTLTPVPAQGYKFYVWEGDLDGVTIDANGVATVPCDQPHDLVCRFIDESHVGVKRAWSGRGDGKSWADPANWSPAGVPGEGDELSVDAGTSLLISETTPEFDSVSIGGTLTFTNWMTRLAAKNITIKSGATVTCAGPFNDTFDMSNRVWFAASEAFTLESGAKINVNELGYGTATNVMVGRSGMGPGKTGWSSGAAYGGCTVSKDPYGDASAPLDPGTSGGTRTSGARLYPGGGAVYIDCPNATVKVNGSITANGHAGSDWNYGPSTGGAIYIRTKQFKTSGATITAIGGNRAGRANSASGGRIAITYDPSVQTVDDVDSSTLISADCGLNGANRTVPPGWNQSSGSTTATDSGRWARPGSVYFPDDLLLGKALGNLGFCGEIVLGSGKTAVIDRGFTISNGFVVFGNNLTNVTVKGDVNLDSVNGYLVFGANKHLSGYTRTQLFVSDSGIAPRLEINGDLTMTMGARLDLNGVMTEGATNGAPAGVLDVKGDIVMSGQACDAAKGLPGLTSIVYCASCPTNGTGFHVFATNVVIGAEARFDGVGLGYQAVNLSNDANSVGPGCGSRTIGAGHGGAALKVNTVYGKTYGEELRPKLPGSSGAPPNARQLANSDSYGVTTGGGFLRLTAYELLDVSGGIVMDGWTPTVGHSGSAQCAAGAGGSLWLEAKNVNAAAGARISAKGGDSMYNGAAGGGRIALWLGAPGLDYADIAAYSETTAAGAGIPDGVLSVDGGWTKSRGDGTEQAGNGSLKIFNAVPMGQNLEIVSDPLDAFGTCEPGYGPHTVAAGGHTYTATDVIDPETQIRSRCIGWTLERLNAESGAYEPVQYGDTGECVFTMDDAMYRLTWKWTFEAKVAVTPTAGGTVGFSVPPKDAGWYTLGSTVTLTPNPSAGYAFTTWGGDVADDKTLDNPLTLTIDAAKELTCGFQAVVPGGQRFTWTGGAANGVWYDTRNWQNDSGVAGLPIVGDTVVFPEDSGTVILDRPTAELTALTVSSGTTLFTTNWTTAIRAQTMTVADGGTVTCAGPFSDRYTEAYQNIDMSNRVWIVCGALNVEQGGTITADGKGYGETGGLSASATRAYGPGGTASKLCGGAHGGIGQKYGSGVALKTAYDSLSAPTLPGSSGGTSSGAVSAGGGVIRIEATGTVALDGTVTACGKPTSGNSGGGAGGTVCILANKVTANGGVVCAAGGAGSAAGGGGRIAIHYDTTAQQTDDIVVLTLDAAPGAVAGSYRDVQATPGTIWAADMTLFKFVGTEYLKGAIAAGGARELTLPGMTVTNTYFAVDGSVTNLTIAGDLKVAGPTTRFLFGANELVYNTTENVRFTAEEIPYRLQVAGDFTVTDGAAADFNAAPTNGLDGAEGAYVDVAGDFAVDGLGAVTSLVRTAVHPLVGATVHFAAENVAIRQSGWVSADGLGWAIGRGNQGGGRGPSPGLAQSNPDEWGKTRGAGHGGEGIRADIGHGTTYDSELRPTKAGSSGASSWGWGKEGGGYVHVRARKQMTVAGRISADAIMGSSERGAAGSGGGILLEAHKFAATETAQITAVGGNHTTDSLTGLGDHPKTYDIGGAAGGGGRVAVLTGLAWYPGLKPRHFHELPLETLFPDGAKLSVLGGASGSSGKYGRAGEGTFKAYYLAKPGLRVLVR